MGLMGKPEEATVEASPANPWEDGEAQRQDAEAFEVRSQPVEAIEEWVLLATERVSIL